MSLKSAFNFALKFNSISATITRRVDATVHDVKITSSNYFRNMSGMEELVYRGREFVISKEYLEGIDLRRGDTLTSELGTFSLDTISEMIILGEIVGFRIRVKW